MAIVRLKKITLYGPLAEKAAVLSAMQSLGTVHVHPLHAAEFKAVSPEVSVAAHDALKFLKQCPTQEPHTLQSSDFVFDRVVEQSNQLRDQIQQLEDERESLQKSVDTTRPWGEFSVPDPAELGGMRLWFYMVPRSQETKLAESPYVWSEVRTDSRSLYVVVVHPAEPSDFPGSMIELDPRSLSRLESRLDHVKQEIERAQLDRVALTRWVKLLERTIAEADDRANLRHVSEQTLDADQVFAVQGWVPENRVDLLRELAKSHSLALTVADPSDDESPPTLLTNPEAFAGGTQCVKLFITPGYRWWDPSIVVLASFALFYAMIISDAGYALLMAILLAIFWGKLSQSESGRHFRNMALILTASSMAYGIAVGSYFGLTPPEGSFPARLKILDTSNLGTMMMISILIGATHLILANVITGYRLRGSLKLLSPVGWIVTILGGLAVGFTSYKITPGWMTTPGYWMVGVGLFFALFANSDRPFPPRGIWDVLGRLGDGLASLMMVSAVFGDILSYLRLFALGLSGAKLAETFNTMAASSADAFAGLGLALAIVIVLVGHSLNFVLGIMGGVVHGLRLNFIEFFNWCAAEEGYPFRPFSRKAGS